MMISSAAFYKCPSLVISSTLDVLVASHKTLPIKSLVPVLTILSPFGSLYKPPAPSSVHISFPTYSFTSYVPVPSILK